jgi:hypothetical protein
MCYVQRWTSPQQNQEYSMRIRTIICALLAVGLLAAGLTACVSAKEKKKDAPKNLPKFSHPLEITNLYLPLASLKQDILEGKEGRKSVRVERTAKPQLHKGFKVGDQTVEALVVEDRDYEDGKLVETTLDYFAQADDGAVYYLGEDVDNYKDGKVTGHSGAWLYGKDTQQLGVLMPAHPKVGDKFRSEDVPKITTEDDEVISVSESATVPAGAFQSCVKIKEKASDGATEYKLYAPGVGCVKEILEDGELSLKSHETTQAAK